MTPMKDRTHDNPHANRFAVGSTAGPGSKTFAWPAHTGQHPKSTCPDCAAKAA